MNSEHVYSEEQLSQLAEHLSRELQPGDRVILEGVMGAGKSSLAQHLISNLCPSEKIMGSPTFAIAHEYGSGKTFISHVDFYRLKSEEEIEIRGLVELFYDSEKIVICEWLSQFPGFEKKVLKYSKQHRNIRINITRLDSGNRHYKISMPHA